MSLIYFKPYGANANSFPADYPEIVWENQDGKPLPDGWVSMQRPDFDAYVAQRQPAMDAALAALPPKPQPTSLLRQDTLTVLNRLTDAESQALHNAQKSDYRVSKFVLMASSSGVIDQADPNYSAAVQLLDSLGIIAASRWPTLLAS